MLKFSIMIVSIFVNENERFKHLNLDEAFDLAMEIFED